MILWIARSKITEYLIKIATIFVHNWSIGRSLWRCWAIRGAKPAKRKLSANTVRLGNARANPWNSNRHTLEVKLFQLCGDRVLFIQKPCTAPVWSWAWGMGLAWTDVSDSVPGRFFFSFAHEMRANLGSQKESNSERHPHACACVFVCVSLCVGSIPKKRPNVDNAMVGDASSDSATPSQRARSDAERMEHGMRTAHHVIGYHTF